MNSEPNPYAEQTVFTSFLIEGRRLDLHADYFPSSIALDSLQARFASSQVLHADPLVLQVSKKGHAVVCRFGAVVFWQCEGTEREKVLEEVRQTAESGPADRDVRDELVVLVNQPEDQVNFRDVWLKSLTLEHVRLISAAMGRSVALKHCERAVAETLRNTAPIVNMLRESGELAPSQKSILRTVGLTMSVKETILGQLGLADDPDEAWESERLARLHTQLRDHFDIEKRVSALQDKMAHLSDLNSMLLTLLQNRTSHRLEWIVVLLILIEIVLSLLHFVLPG